MMFPIKDSNVLLNGRPINRLYAAGDLIGFDGRSVTVRSGPMSSLGGYLVQRDEIVRNHPTIEPISLTFDDPDSDRVLSFAGGRLLNTDMDESGMLVQVLEFEEVA